MDAFPLYDSAFEHEACGVGFIAARSLEPSFRMTRLAVECLVRLDHRGARAADGTGDGAGIMTELPHRLIARELASKGIHDVPRDRIGMIMAFLPNDRTDEARELIESALAYENVPVLAWRRVPIDPGVLSQRAKDTLPTIEQVIVGSPYDVDSDGFERRLFLARKHMERAGSHLDLFSIP
ncbi:MAG TPA: glutamate synthase subunit alpha, partial [Acidimicrobiia bacterium]